MYFSKKNKQKTEDDQKRKSFANDVFTLVGGTTFAQIVTILSSPVLTRLYRPEDFGVWTLILSIKTTIGVITCLRYEQSIMLPKSDKKASNLFALSLVFVSIITLLSIPFIYFFKDFIVETLNSPQLGTYLWWLPIFILVSGILLAFNQWSARKRRFENLAAARISNSLSTTGTQVALGAGLHTSAPGLIAGSLVGIISSTLIQGKSILKNDKEDFKESITSTEMKDGLKRYRKFPLIDTWSVLLNTVSWQLPAFLLAIFFSPTVVGFYTLGFRLLQLPMSFIGSSISQVFYQRASVANIEKKLDVLVENVFRMLVIIGMFPILSVTIVGSDIFTVFFGQTWTEAGVYSQILSIWAFVWFVSSPLDDIFLIQEKQHFSLLFNIFNFATRLLSLIIGGYLGNARIALILFATSGILVYGYVGLKVMSYAGVKMSRVVEIVASSLRYFIPAGIILVILKLLEVNQILLVIVSSLLIMCYYAYIIKTDEQIKQLINSFDIAKKLNISKSR